VIKIVTGTKNNLMRYGKLTDEEKELYDISKVKMSQILFELSLVVLVILAFVPNVIASNTFIVCYLVEIVVLLIFSKTKCILNLFCKKK
jgi:hypothetical protein